VSEESELFWQVMGRGLIHPGDQEALRLLRQATSGWRRAGRDFNAGLAMTRAIHAAWGTDGGVQACAEEALQDFQRCESTAPPCSPESLLALHRRALELRHYIPDRPRSALWEEVAYRLFTHYSDSPHAESYLVRGFVFKSNLDGEWEPEFPPWEVEIGPETAVNGVVSISFPSAFRLFVRLTDYQAANDIVERFPHAFSTPGLRGWKAAVRGFVAHQEAPERFEEAAAAFAEDVMPAEGELALRAVSWSSINTDLWAKYFRARAAVALTVRQPTRVPELIRTAAVELQRTESVWVDSNVSKFRILVQTLAQLLSEGPGLSPAEARAQFTRETQLLGQDPEDDVSLRFLGLVCEAFEGFRTDPAKEIVSGRIHAALEALTRIPLIGRDIASVVAPAIGARAFEVAGGPDRSWVHRTLEGIRKDSVLRRIILRLLQSAPSPPAYAHIRHGPVEYGKDVVVLLEEGGQRVLRMYQAKCGEMKMPDWRIARRQLEEMFQVEMSTFQLPALPDTVEGILICNGHAHPIVEPAMAGWFAEQKRDHGRSFRFMHLDDLVQWIDSQRLYSAFRQVCTEAAPPVEAKPAGNKQAAKARKRKKP
jgi:hypothetical protein